jgi:hypothetical protein
MQAVKQEREIPCGVKPEMKMIRYMCGVAITLYHDLAQIRRV